MSTNKQLYERRRDKGWIITDQWCKENVPEYIDARNKREFERAFSIVCRHIEVTLNDTRFVYFINHNFTYYKTLNNVTPNYEKILVQGFDSFYMESDSSYAKSQNEIVKNCLYLVDKIIDALKKQKPENYEKKIAYFSRMKNVPAEGFEEALQRILFVNQLMWQMNGRLVGLGHLDKLLAQIYEKQIKEGTLTVDEAYLCIQDFYKTLHEWYWYKSAALLGDTGQIIVLGGTCEDGTYFCNELTELFLKAVKELKASDPKVVLRVNKNTPQEIWELAMDCMASGVGSPLLSNDDVIIPKLIDFGVEKEDAYAYGTSACWEPLIVGKSSSMNNEDSLCFMDVLYKLLSEENLKNISDFEMLKGRYFYYLKREIVLLKKTLSKTVYERNPLYSMFLDGCRECEKDFAEGGAKYHNIGITTVSLGNTINALYNIRKYVFEEKRFTLVDVKKMCVADFAGYEEVAELLKYNECQYGIDDSEVIDFTNQILRFVTESTKNFTLPDGGKLKFGVSSPRYIMDGGVAKASFDGRREGDAYLVHISNDKASSYIETLRFAAGLDYAENRFNGNVVDLMASPSFIENHKAKLIEVLKAGFAMGVFQLQMNVVSSETLIAAKNEPEKYPNLVVRVWGFSAYFHDLPGSYQELLIERALKNEGK